MNTLKGLGFMTTTHEFDVFCDAQDFAELDYHEQLLVLHEFEEQRIAAIKREGAVEALAVLQARIQQQREFSYQQCWFDSTQGLATALVLLGNYQSELRGGVA